MAVLVIYLFLAAAGGFFVQIYGNRNWKLNYLRAVMLVAFLYMALRDTSVGIDTENYMSFYRIIAKDGFAAVPRQNELEKGYVLLNILVNLVAFHDQMILVVTSFMVVYSFYFLIKHYSLNYGLSAVIFISSIFAITMNTTRQFLALCFVFFAVHFILRKNGAKAVLMMLLAFSMHYSAVIMAPLLIFLNTEFLRQKKYFFLIVISIVLVIPFFSFFLDLLLYLFPQYNRFLTNRLANENPISTVYLLQLIVLMLLGFFVLFPVRIVRNKHIKLYFNKGTYISVNGVSEDTLRIFQFFFVLFLLYIVVYTLSGRMVIIYRAVYYFQPFLVVFIPMLLGLLRRRSKALYYLCSTVLLVYYLRFGVLYFKNDPHGILPYSFFFE